jgi:hypothetical protein
LFAKICTYNHHQMPSKPLNYACVDFWLAMKNRNKHTIRSLFFFLVIRVVLHPPTDLRIHTPQALSIPLADPIMSCVDAVCIGQFASTLEVFTYRCCMHVLCICKRMYIHACIYRVCACVYVCIYVCA